MRRIFWHVVAHGDNFAIGAKGGLPWHLPEDLKFFKQLTMGHIIVMGRKTFDSIGRPLPGRYNIVVSSALSNNRSDVTVVRNWSEAEHLVTSLSDWPECVFIVGGASLYQLTLPVIAGAYVTRVPLSPEGDAFYFDLQSKGFSCTASREGITSPTLSYQTWERDKQP